jgi:hypothetical protein
MTLAALLDLEPDNYDYLISRLKTLGINGEWSMNAERRNKNGIDASYIKVVLHDDHDHDHGDHDHSHDHHHDHDHRNFADIANIIKGGDITPGAKKIAESIFWRIAVAEGKIHGRAPESVNFHEVGAVDSIIDIVGAAILLDLIISRHEIEKICCSVVNDGHGFTYCQHGKIPIPAPATAEIFSNAKVKTRQIDVPKELVTPTGAAIIAEIASEFGFMPEMTPLKTGYGAGTRDLDIPNVVRVVLGEIEQTPVSSADTPFQKGAYERETRAIDNRPYEDITVIETNIDDCASEILAYTMEKLLGAGANDVFFTPVYMKKNRPAVKLTALCRSEMTGALAKIIFAETTTIGLRMREEKRICLKREEKIIATGYGELKVKEIEFNGEKKIIPEYESAKILAENAGVPLREIYENYNKI